MLHRVHPFIVLLVILVSCGTIYFTWKNSIPLVSPIALIETITGNSVATKSPKIVYGFFPYWNSKYSEELNIQNLTHFAYFAIDLNPDGSINKQNDRKELEPGWNKLNLGSTKKILYQAKLLGQKTVLTATAMTPDLIESIVNNSSYSISAINSILDIYQDSHFDDINVDFEYVGSPTQETKNNFTFFVKNLHKACTDINPNCAIDIDIFGDTANRNRLWDLSALNPFINRVIVMAYDYYRKGSSQAGPVAPITGQCKNNIRQTPCLEQDIISNLSSIIKLVPSEKVILGIPFYGYQWQTASSDFLANTYSGTGSLATYARIQTLFNDPKISSLSAIWSETTLSPYLTFTQNNSYYQIHFENSESIKEKIKLVKTANLGGVAIWALGYETPFNDIWKPFSLLITP